MTAHTRRQQKSSSRYWGGGGRAQREPWTLKRGSLSAFLLLGPPERHCPAGPGLGNAGSAVPAEAAAAPGCPEPLPSPESPTCVPQEQNGLFFLTFHILPDWGHHFVCISSSWFNQYRFHFFPIKKNEAGSEEKTILQSSERGVLAVVVVAVRGLAQAECEIWAGKDKESLT